jgi:hypothetical protein
VSAFAPLQKLSIPDLWQQEAVRALRSGFDVVVHAPTGAGKTLIFELLYGALKGQCVFTVPTRALANDKYAEWRARGWEVGIATGDVAEGLDRRVVVATLETQLQRLLAGNGPRLLVVDEYQMIGDAVRGVHYEMAIAVAPPKTQLLLLSGSVANPQDVVAWLERIGRNCRLVSHQERPVPLEEVDLAGLPERASSQIRGWWPRAIANALQQDLGPILLFAPRRRTAETLAQQLAAALPPCAPLHLEESQQQIAGRVLMRMLKARVAFHHSGLSYAQRVQVIEPLAKAGQLRVVVATMGLAAGINFSMRSVLIAGTTYMAGPFEKRVTAAELLQMYGRAGRRGLDTQGYALATPQPPRLADAQPLPLRRSTQLDWPSLLSVLVHADPQLDSPFRAAVRLNERLFSPSAPALGCELSLQSGPTPCGFWVDAERARFIRRGQEWIWNSAGEWELCAARKQAVPLAEILVWKAAGEEGADPKKPRGKWAPAESLPEWIQPIGKGPLCRLPGAAKRYGKQVHIGGRAGDGSLRVAGWMRERLGGSRVAADEVVERVVAKIPEWTGGGCVVALVPKGDQLFAQLSYGQVRREAYRDASGRGLADAPVRRQVPVPCEGCVQRSVCEAPQDFHSPAHAWRELGLVDGAGVPTDRGRMFSFFQHGEGLAIAAALEEEGYPIADLVFDLADLRGGPRFAEEEGTALGRLGLCCQRAYRNADYEGYLRFGMPAEYGAGASEVVREILENRTPVARLVGEGLRAGDIERALLEWRSLLRHIVYAPVHPWPRWSELQKAAAEMLARH